jgi:hypothetical protein
MTRLLSVVEPKPVHIVVFKKLKKKKKKSITYLLPFISLEILKDKKFGSLPPQNHH